MNNDMNDLTFNTVRELYKNLRMLELYKIKEYLDTCPKLKGTKTSIYQGVKGCDNWLGLDVEINNGKKYFISLQPFGRDKDNGNRYVVMDRIGLYKYDKSNRKLNTKDALGKMDDTYITLPINEEKLNQLVKKLK